MANVNENFIVQTGITAAGNIITLGNIIVGNTTISSSGISGPGASPYDIAGSMLGKPANSAVISRMVAVRAFRIPASATGSLSKSAVAATASTTYSLQKNGVQFGTMVYSAAGTTGAFTVASNADFAIGDVMTVVAPATADTTHADMEFTLVSTLL